MGGSAQPGANVTGRCTGEAINARFAWITPQIGCFPGVMDLILSLNIPLVTNICTLVNDLERPLPLGKKKLGYEMQPVALTGRGAWVGDKAGDNFIHKIIPDTPESNQVSSWRK